MWKSVKSTWTLGETWLRTHKLKFASISCKYREFIAHFKLNLVLSRWWWCCCCFARFVAVVALNFKYTTLLGSKFVLYIRIFAWKGKFLCGKWPLSRTIDNKEKCSVFKRYTIKISEEIWWSKHPKKIFGLKTIKMCNSSHMNVAWIPKEYHTLIFITEFFLWHFGVEKGLRFVSRTYYVRSRSLEWCT